MLTNIHPLPLRRFVVPPKLPEPTNPALVQHAEARAMISQNRAHTQRQVIADQQWQTVQEEDRQNRQLLDLSEQILELTKAVHAYAEAATGAAGRAGARDAGADRPAAESMTGRPRGRPVTTGTLGRGQMAPGGLTSTGNATVRR